MDSAAPAPGPSFSLLETMRLEHGQVQRLERHLARMANAARYFAYQWSESAVREAVADVAREHPQGCWRLRLLLSADGRPRSNARLTRTRRFPGAWTSHAIRSTHAIRSSSTRRHAAWSTKTPDGRAPTWTMCFCGTSGEKSQSRRSETWWPRSTACATRRRSASGLLGGTFRGEQLEAGTIHERVLTKADIASASRLWLINSVREWVEAILVVSGRR